MFLILIIILLVFMFGGLPGLGYHQYGWGPSGLAMVVLVVLVIFMLFRRM